MKIRRVACHRYGCFATSSQCRSNPSLPPAIGSTLATRKSYKNFHLRFEYRLIGTEGFVNGGVQFRSKRIANPANEMSGYQADIGAGYSGCLYDESRRNKMLAMADTNLVARLEKPGDWNRYEVIARGKDIQFLLNGQPTVTWVERDEGIDAEGVIALQIHGNCKAEISFRNITIEELPSPAGKTQAEVLRRFGEGQPVLDRSAGVEELGLGVDGETFRGKA